MRKLALHLYYSRLRNLVTIVLIICAGTLVGFVFSEVQTTGDEAGYRNALEQAMGTHAFNELALTIDSLFFIAIFFDVALYCVVRRTPTATSTPNPIPIPNPTPTPTLTLPLPLPLTRCAASSRPLRMDAPS